jgi:hypothetical protein
MKMLCALLVVSITGVVYIYIYVINTTKEMKEKDKKTKSGYIISLFMGILIGVILWALAMTVLPWVMVGRFDILRYWFTNSMFGECAGGYGELKIIDPDSLAIVADLKLVERASFGRMALSAVSETEDAIVLAGDEFIRQYRWNSKTRKLYEKEDWALRYRRRYDGTFPGTGPCIFEGVTYFTDNTFPVFLWGGGNSYTLFKRTLNATTRVNDDGFDKTDMVKLATGNNWPGFMFWSVGVSPSTRDVVVWDIANTNLQVRGADSLELKWKLNTVQSDCVSITADKGHIYFADYSYNPGPWFAWGYAIGMDSEKLNPHVNKYFVVGDIETGNVLFNTTVQVGGGFKASTLVPGGNDDVIMATATTLVRLYYH